MAPLPVLYLLDTNILLYYARGSALSLWLDAVYALRTSADLPRISIVSVGEIRSLALQNMWGKDKMRQLEEFLNNCIIIPLDLPGIVESYAEIDTYLRHNGRQ